MLAVLGAAWMLGVGVARAAELATVSASLKSNGSGFMIANSQTNPETETWSWEACKPDLSRCSSFATGRGVSTAGAMPETVFRVRSSLGATALSPLWKGSLASTAPPSVAGEVQSNELVTPVAGQWRGGWDGDTDLFQLSACRSRLGLNCTTLTHTNYPEACSGEAAVIDPEFTGQYLRVANMRIGPDTLFLAYAVRSPYGHEIWKADPRTSGAILGRIARADGPRTNRCGAPPLFEASISKLGLASVRCTDECRAVLIAKRGRLRARVVHELPPTPFVPPGFRDENSFQELQLPQGASARLGAGRASMIVKVNGKQAAARTVALDLGP